MLDPVPAYVETAIYCYFGLVASIGLYLHVRFRAAARRVAND